MLPIVYHEVTIYNVQAWNTAISSTTHFMQFSRTMLLIGAISNKINETVARDCDLSDQDLDIIRELLMEAAPSNRLSLLQGLASNFKVLSLCKTKLIVLQLGLQVTKIWQNFTDSDEEVLAKLAFFNGVLTAALCQYTTHYILNENGLLNSTTMELANRPLDLLQHIFTNETNWDEPSDIGMRVSELAFCTRFYVLNPLLTPPFRTENEDLE